MLRTSITIALALLLVPACKKKEGEGGAKAAEGAKPAEGVKAADKPAAAGAPTMDAAALFADYNKPGQDGMALMEKWRAGVVVNGDVKNVVGEDTVWLNAGEGVNLSVGFADGGKAMKEKALKAGDKISAQCQVGGSDGKLMMLTDCVLK